MHVASMYLCVRANVLYMSVLLQQKTVVSEINLKCFGWLDTPLSTTTTLKREFSEVALLLTVDPPSFTFDHRGGEHSLTLQLPQFLCVHSE